MSNWIIEGFFGTNGGIRKMPLSDFPQVLGRDDTLTCAIMSPGVSRQHAKVEVISGQLHITDLKSSNGTYVNRERIGNTTAIGHGDILHFGDLELRIIDQARSEQAAPAPDANQTVFLEKPDLSQAFPAGVMALEEVIEKGMVNPCFQPIFNGADLSVRGYEALGRGSSNKIPQSPLALFKIAESVGLEVKLSQLMRKVGIETAAKHNLKGSIWVNTHPQEMLQPDTLLASLLELRKTHTRLQLVFEVHEHCVTDIASLMYLKQELSKMGIQLAFDDFGVGQSRLMELVEAKPDIIKFDKMMIEGLDNADPGRLNLLRHLKEISDELEITTLAECVENEAEYGACERIGFDLYQGYYFGRPQQAQYFC